MRGAFRRGTPVPHGRASKSLQDAGRPHLIGSRLTLEAHARERVEVLESRPSAHLAKVRVLGEWPLWIETRDKTVGLENLHSGYYETFITLAVARYLRPGMFCVDIGANCGYFTALMAGIVGDRGCVLAVEPNPDMVKALNETIRTNNWSSFVSTDPRAVWSKSGLSKELDLDPEQAGGASVKAASIAGPSPGAVVVETITLDDLLAGWPRVDFIKIDTEAAEVDIWRGMQEMLKRNPRCTVAVEVSSRRDYNVATLAREMIAAGYSLLEIIPTGDVLPVTPDELALGDGHGTWNMLWLSKDARWLAHAQTYGEELKRFLGARLERPKPTDSSRSVGLAASLQVQLASTTVGEGTVLAGTAQIRNTRETVWLPLSASTGAVRLRRSSSEPRWGAAEPRLPPGRSDTGWWAPDHARGVRRHRDLRACAPEGPLHAGVRPRCCRRRHLVRRGGN